MAPQAERFAVNPNAESLAQERAAAHRPLDLIFALIWSAPALDTVDARAAWAHRSGCARLKPS
jgi:hypothetical protein